MGLRWPAKQGREVVLRALLSLLFAFAPLLAQVAISGQAVAAPAHHAVAPVNAQSHTGHDGHSHDHGDDQAGSDQSHDTSAAHGDDLATSDQDHRTTTLSVADAAPCPSGHADHDNGADAGCCGTFCHSSMALLAVPLARHKHARAVFIAFSGMPTESVVPGQPDRPPQF
jgi:hypothetical protein